MKFYELFKTGKVTEDAIHTFIDKWHNDEGNDERLHEFLGLTWEQYCDWVNKGILE